MSSLSPRLRWSAALLALALCGWAALAPLRYSTRESPLALAAGLPGEVELALGVRDVLLLVNRDRTPHVFGQVRVLPGRSFRLPFEETGTYVFACDVARGARVTVRVGPHPDPGWPRLRWRLRALVDAVRTLPLQGPDD